MSWYGTRTRAEPGAGPGAWAGGSPARYRASTRARASLSPGARPDVSALAAAQPGTARSASRCRERAGARRPATRNVPPDSGVSTTSSPGTGLMPVRARTFAPCVTSTRLPSAGRSAAIRRTARVRSGSRARSSKIESSAPTAPRGRTPGAPSRGIGTSGSRARVRPGRRGTGRRRPPDEPLPGRPRSGCAGLGSRRIGTRGDHRLLAWSWHAASGRSGRPLAATPTAPRRPGRPPGPGQEHQRGDDVHAGAPPEREPRVTRRGHHFMAPYTRA